MAYLITYPEQNISVELRNQLAAKAETIYLPLRKFRSVVLSEADEALIRNSRFLILTSPVSVKLYLKQLKLLNPTATILVLSHKMADALTAGGVHNVRVAGAETGRSLAQMISLPMAASVCLLRGDRSAIQRFLPVKVHQVMIYQNYWDQHLNDQAIEKLNGYYFTKVLVTSPSSFERLQTIMKQIPESFAHVTYYALGQTTANVISPQQVVVGDRHDVLKSTILKMCME